MLCIVARGAEAIRGHKKTRAGMAGAGLAFKSGKYR